MSDHLYRSTACLHDLHERCRRQCKYCSARCSCPCHASTCTSTWGAQQDRGGDSLYCGLPEGHPHEHVDLSPLTGGGRWSDEQADPEPAE